MELETLFTDVKWNILQALSKREQSPLEIANNLQTTISNISQQLKLLEVAGLVKKKKISNREKGKPRTIFSIAQDYSYMISIMNNFTKKRLMKLTPHHKSILKIWLTEDPQLHYYIEKFYWKIEELLQDIQGIAIKLRDKIEVIIITEKPKKLGKIEIRKRGGETKVFYCKEYTQKELERNSKVLKEFQTVYDPNQIIWDLKNGGDI